MDSVPAAERIEREVGEAATRGNLLFSLAVALLVAGILVAINVIGAKVLGWTSYDLSTDRIHSLSPATLRTLAAIDEAGTTIEVTGYFAADRVLSLYQPSIFERAERLLDLYAERCPRAQVSVKLQDRDASAWQRAAQEIPGFAANVIVVRAGERVEVLPLEAMATSIERDEVRDGRGVGRAVRIRYVFTGEAALTAALERLRLGTRLRVLVTTGHGEVRFDDAESATGYGVAAERLEALGFELVPFAPAGASVIPADADVVVIAGPRSGAAGGAMFPPDEIALLDAFLGRGGGVLVLLDYGTRAGLDALLASFGVVAHIEALACDTDPLAGGTGERPTAFFASRYGEHPVTAGLAGAGISSIPTAWQDAVVVLPAERSPPGVIVTPLVATSVTGWGETEPLAAGTPRFDRGFDLIGGLVLEPGGPPAGVTVAIASERSQAGTPAGRMVVIGARTLAANRPIAGVVDATNPRFEANLGLVRNALAWLAGQERHAAGIAGRGARVRFDLGPRRAERLFALAFVHVPLAIILAGVTVWARRQRHRRLFVVLLIADFVFVLHFALRVLVRAESL